MPETVASCTPQELRERMNSQSAFVLLDVRTDDELAIARLPECVHIPLHELEQRVSELEPYRDQEVVVMCHHGGRSAQAQRCLLSLGFPQVTNLTGGIDLYAVYVDSTLPRY